MKKFAQLIQQLERSNKTNDKLKALHSYFTEAPAKDKIYVLALFTGKKPKRPVNTTLLKRWALELIQIPEWLFTECYHNVGDLSETIALLLPPASTEIEKPLHQWITELRTLITATETEKRNYILESWMRLNTAERFIFNKLISGNFRIGVSAKMIVNALAQYAKLEPHALMHSIMGKWSPEEIEFEDLIRGTHVNTDISWPYPFCLAHPLEMELEQLGNLEDWLCEWKWDGIRGQIIVRAQQLFIWSRGEELVTAQFPELHYLKDALPDGTVLDGEILAMQNGQVLAFNLLQQRLNRKTINQKQLEQVPIGLIVYDLLEFKGLDLRKQALAQRRLKLKQLFNEVPLQENTHLSPLLEAVDWNAIARQREDARNIQSEGLMLKHKQSIYHSGRKRGDWWKWKINPYTIDAVLIYAQKGSGRRAQYYTDYTFAVRNGTELVSIAKAYSGLTDLEIKEVNRFILKNAIEKFGPVRTVKAELVFEIAFEGLLESKRHKAGLALRFPRIARWRKDKKVEDINTLEDLRDLLKLSQTPI